MAGNDMSVIQRPGGARRDSWCAGVGRLTAAGRSTRCRPAISLTDLRPVIYLLLVELAKTRFCQTPQARRPRRVTTEA